jgi:nucleotide-binding universal stress UspA family protein
MAEIKRILFHTNFSPEANRAMDYAWTLTEKFTARLYLLHIIENPTSQLYEMVSGDYHALDRNALEKSQQWLARLHHEQLGNSPNCETLIERGEIFEHVLRVVRQKDVDLIVVGAHVHKGFRLHLLADFPEKLVRKAPCHVFVVHE